MASEQTFRPRDLPAVFLLTSVFGRCSNKLPPAKRLKTVRTSRPSVAKVRGPVARLRSLLHSSPGENRGVRRATLFLVTALGEGVFLAHLRRWLNSAL